MTHTDQVDWALNGPEQRASVLVADRSGCVLRDTLARAAVVVEECARPNPLSELAKTGSLLMGGSIERIEVEKGSVRVKTYLRMLSTRHSPRNRPHQPSGPLSEAINPCKCSKSSFLSLPLEGRSAKVSS